MSYGSGGFWGVVAINASDWDSLCVSGPAILLVDGRRFVIRFLRAPYYCTVFGLFALFAVMLAVRPVFYCEESDR